jgi:outer membrane lipoprotein-sorting protein
MNCAEFKELSVAYVEGLLDEQKNRSVTEHLKDCAACQAELKSLTDFRNRLVENGKVLAQSGLEDDVMDQIVREQNARLKAAVTAGTALNLRRIIMKTRIVKLAAAAAIIIVVLIGIHQLAGNGTGAVFASVVEQLHNARTMTYSVVTHTPVEGMPTMRTEMAFKEPAYMRATTADGFVTVMDWTQVRGISIWPTRKQFISFEATNFRHDPEKDPFMVIENLKTLPYKADHMLGKKDVDGRLLQGFRVVEESVINTIWIDPETEELVRVEMEFTNAPGMNKIMTDFQFNVELDDSLFSLTPPEGFAPLEVQADVSKVTEQDLIDYLRSWSSWTKDGMFPPILVGAELPKIAAEMARQGKFGEGQTTEQQHDQDAITMYRGIMFVTQLPAESNWRYAGENVRYGDADTPIFWYRPTGSETYRVIYGDLSVKDVASEDLPK